MWWKSAIPKHLPLGQGPYVPAALDVMSDYSAQSTFLRLYYPTSLSKEENNQKRWIKWVPHDKYLEGFGYVANFWPSIIKLFIWTQGGNPVIPCVWEEAPLSDKQKMPIIIFSHGFGATRFLSAGIGLELASHGYLFASIEHRETSAAATYYYESPDKVESDEPVWIKHLKMQFGPDHYSIRNTQVHKRKVEVQNVIDYLETLNNGTAKSILKSKFDLTCFKGLLDMSSVCMMGHSFGGATSLLTMAHDKRLTCGVILDGWMFPIKEEEITIEQPLIFINTQTFHIASNLLAMEKFLTEPAGAQREVFTIHHTTHESQTDTALLMGCWLNLFMHKLKPEVANNINNFLTLKFLKKYIGIPKDVKMCEEYLENHKDDYVSATYVYTKDGQRNFNIKNNL